MALLIKKFGGTSVGDIEKIQKIACSICQSKESGNDIVVVVSAMGNSTDKLNQLAESVSENPNLRELDMLLSTGEQVTLLLNQLMAKQEFLILKQRESKTILIKDTSLSLLAFREQR